MTLHSIPSVFLFLFCSITVSNVYSQQIKAETFNFTELAQIQATQSFKIEGEHEIDGGWRYLKGNLPFPYNAKIIKQKIESIPVPNTVELPSPLPLQSFLGHIDPINFRKSVV